MTMDKKNVLMWVSLFWGAFLILTWMTQMYFAVWRHEVLFEMNPNRLEINSTSNLTRMDAVNSVRHREVDPMTVLLSPTSILMLITGIIVLANGLYLMHVTRKTEKNKVKSDTISQLLTPDEKILYEIIVQKNGEVTQKELTVKSGLSPVKVYRNLLKLEKKNIIKTYPYGMTKKIIRI